MMLIRHVKYELVISKTRRQSTCPALQYLPFSTREGDCAPCAETGLRFTLDSRRFDRHRASIPNPSQAFRDEPFGPGLMNKRRTQAWGRVQSTPAHSTSSAAANDGGCDGQAAPPSTPHPHRSQHPSSRARRVTCAAVDGVEVNAAACQRAAPPASAPADKRRARCRPRPPQGGFESGAGRGRACLGPVFRSREA